VTALPVHVLVLWLLRDSLWLGVFILWWLKPVFSRVSLFFLSRMLFGERPGIGQVLRAWPAMWLRRFPYRMLWARFSPWRAMTAPVEELERLRGDGYGQRCAQLLARGQGTALGLAAICWGLTAVVAIGLLSLGLMFIPDEVMLRWQVDVELWMEGDEFGLPMAIQWLLAVVVLASMGLVEVLYTGAGFGLYVNSRTLIEGWDIELALKRLRDRLGGLARSAALVVVAILVMGAAEPGHAAEPAEQIKEVLADPDFTIHRVEEKVWVPDPGRSSSSRSSNNGLAAIFGGAFAIVGWLLLAALVGLVVWLIVRYWPQGTGAGAGDAPLRRQVRTVMGMDIAPETLPADIPGAAWQAWQAGRHHEALSLLYRGAIGAFVTQAHLEIDEGDTESDCLRRVGILGPTREGSYFAGLTNLWLRLAYGRRSPEDHEVQALCRDWPFVRGGQR
jgi:hypothetical protein